MSDGRQSAISDTKSGSFDHQQVDYALYELSTLRDDLELTAGDPSVLQLGGVHRDVLKNEDKKAGGYESHHIPSQVVLLDNKFDLPTIALKKEDHKLTDSYAGKQGKKFQSFLPGVSASDTYKNEVIKKIEEGGFMSIVRNEIYNIRDQFGTKYDGAIAQYLDALGDYIKKNGVPKVKK